MALALASKPLETKDSHSLSGLVRCSMRSPDRGAPLLPLKPSNREDCPVARSASMQAIDARSRLGESSPIWFSPEWEEKWERQSKMEQAEVQLARFTEKGLSIRARRLRLTEEPHATPWVDYNELSGFRFSECPRSSALEAQPKPGGGRQDIQKESHSPKCALRADLGGKSHGAICHLI